MPRKTIPIPEMEALDAKKLAVIITTCFNQQMAIIQVSGKVFTYQRMLENFVLI